MCKICTQKKRCVREADKETTCKRRDVIHDEKFSKNLRDLLRVTVEPMGFLESILSRLKM